MLKQFIDAPIDQVIVVGGITSPVSNLIHVDQLATDMVLEDLIIELAVWREKLRL